VNKLDGKLRAFVSEPNIGILATLRTDGSPHQTAIWYLLDGDVLKVSITDGRAKYKHVMRDPRVSLAVASTAIPYKEVVFEGRAVIEREGGHELFRRLAIHYYGEVDGNAYADYSRDVAKDNRLVLSLQPDRVMSWDFAQEDDYHQPWKQTAFDPLVRSLPASGGDSAGG
jgi:PPOX class probable F420-dependent enzyme